MRKPLTWGLLLLVLAGVWWMQDRSAQVGSARTPTVSTANGARTVAAQTTAASRGGPAARLTTSSAASALPDFLPAEAVRSITLIQRGGPFPHHQDGGVFGNFESHLPRQPRGWYHEYTVETPGARNRGTRRIITGGTPPREWYYTDDHYASFRRFDVH